MGGFSVASFNLKDYFAPQPGHEAAVSRAKFEHVVAKLRAADADVALLQEVGDEALLRDTFAALGWTRADFLIGAADHRGIRCAIVSKEGFVRAEAISASALTFPRFNVEDPEPFEGAIPLRRPVLRADVRMGAEVLTCFTAHFKSQLPAPQKQAGRPLPFTTDLDWADAMVRSLVQRIAEARKLKVHLEEAQRERPLVIAGGDFNDVPNSVPLAVLLAGDATTRVVDLVATRLAPESSFSVLHRGAPSRIDYLLGAPPLAARLETVRVLNEGLRDHGPHDPSAPPQPDSDHALVVATFA